MQAEGSNASANGETYSLDSYLLMGDTISAQCFAKYFIVLFAILE